MDSMVPHLAEPEVLNALVLVSRCGSLCQVDGEAGGLDMHGHLHGAN